MVATLWEPTFTLTAPACAAAWKTLPGSSVLLAGLAYCWKAESAAENLGASVEYLGLDFPNRQYSENLAGSAECHPALLPHFPNHLHWESLAKSVEYPQRTSAAGCFDFHSWFQTTFSQRIQEPASLFPGKFIQRIHFFSFSEYEKSAICESRSTPVLLNSLDAYNLTRNIFAECRIMLDKQHCRFLLQKQFSICILEKISM